MMRARVGPAGSLLICVLLCAQAPLDETLQGTTPLELGEPLDVAMVRGINRFAEEELSLSPARREKLWSRDSSSREAYENSIDANRTRLRALIGAVEERTADPSWSSVTFTGESSELTALFRDRKLTYVRAEVFPGVSVEAVAGSRPSLIVIPDADWSPEAVQDLDSADAPAGGLARALGPLGPGMIVPALISRDDTFSGRPEIRFTNQPHREFIYRPAFELGRHVIGYEVQKIQTLIDLREASGEGSSAPIIVWGVGEGGLLALYAAAIDPRIDVCVVSGYFGEREGVWKEPIYRNVWRGLAEFGDAELASLIAPRTLIIEACAVPEVFGPPTPREARSGAAPGMIANVPLDSVEREFERAQRHYQSLQAETEIRLIRSGDGSGPWAAAETVEAVLARVPDGLHDAPHEPPPSAQPLSATQAAALASMNATRQKGQIEELQRHTQRVLHQSDKDRDKVWAQADRSSLDTWETTQESYRVLVENELIGRIAYPLLPPRVRSRRVIDEPTHVGYEVALDVFASDFSGSEPIIAGGILLVPKDLKPNERRPCVVCQHGLEGTPLDTIVTDPAASGFGPYQGFSTQLVQQGFIVYAPQNPYRGHDEFRVIQRKSNPLGRSLFSYIVPQHAQTLNWLATLPWVDAQRIAFYGLSYGGKTAMRVPPLLPPGRENAGSPGYCLSICSADFNEWVLKNASTDDRYSYVFTQEYEIFEWNMGHVANYAELASLMTPRPFMVERGHDDGVAPDEWVFWEFAKVKRHYDRLGIGDRTEIEVFNGPHQIHGRGTFEFLHRHLRWPE